MGLVTEHVLDRTISNCLHKELAFFYLCVYSFLIRIRGVMEEMKVMRMSVHCEPAPEISHHPATTRGNVWHTTRVSLPAVVVIVFLLHMCSLHDCSLVGDHRLISISWHCRQLQVVRMSRDRRPAHPACHSTCVWQNIPAQRTFFLVWCSR